MHVIVTHSNADFDAVASLLGAWLLYSDALPVLPNSINRNVRDFVTLYENELPFVRQNDLGGEAITRVTVVDCQHLPTLKGLQADAQVHIIDHHDQQSPPESAVLSLTDTGANVTLLVEQMREQRLRLSSIEATLLLLGIYEDTGSLTYGGTTPRDLQAASWLLAAGRARLDIVREYLNYPMSSEQHTLYEQLVSKLENHIIHGHNIAIGLASVDRYVEEISSLAHRLRDLYRPDALFILVDMRDHVQLVARSTTNHIDVGRVAKYFGGGGHPRAAAALVKAQKIDQIKKDLIRYLRLQITPAVTVAQIMSRGVRTLAPSDTVGHAAQMMDRYGHEGFPVVSPQTGKIVGVLSRREIDKALRHKLEGAVISQFMKKGGFFVTSVDGVDAVQNLMVEQQIGQVPVIDSVQGKVIGIVTRTDLINLWHKSRISGEASPNLTPQLEQSLSTPLLAMLHQAGQLAADHGDALYVVGGFVRDVCLTILADNHHPGSAKTSPRFDLDLVVEGDAIALAQRLKDQNGGRVVSHHRFGTAKWILTEPIPFNPGSEPAAQLSSLDFVTARTEFYQHPSALPEVEQSSVRQDLHRRDFTINTLALRLTPHRFGELLDFYGGQSDLESRLIRVLHSLSFVEDPTRMLRAARLLARLDFKLEERTYELLRNALDLLARVSGERILNELILIFKERTPEQALKQLDRLGILAAIHPGLLVDDWLTEQLVLMRRGLSATPWADVTPNTIHYLGLMAFFLAGDELNAFMERLNLRSDQRTILKQMHTIRRNFRQIALAENNSDLYHLLASTSDDARMIAWVGLDNEMARRKLIHFQTTLRHTEPIIDGHYLKEVLKLPTGPIYKIILEALRDAHLDGNIATLADERALAEKIIAETDVDGQPKKG